MRNGLTAVAAALLIPAVAALAAAAVAAWPLPDPALRRQVLDAVEAATGLSAEASGPLSLRLLPVPTLQFDNVSLAGLGGALSLEAAALRARLDLRALLGGGLRVARAGLDEPTLVVDIDRVQPLVASLADRAALRARLPLLRLGGLALHRGVLRLRSADPRRDTLVTDLSATFSWQSAEAGASLQGSATWRGVSGRFALDLAEPGALLAGGASLASASLHSTALDADVQGSVTAADGLGATGKLTASTTDLNAFLRTADVTAPQLAGLHRARLRGSAALDAGTLSLDPITLDLDDMVFDGALTVHRRGERTGLAGTLATEGMDFGPFLDGLPAALDARGAWSTAPLMTRAIAFDDIDLRISASLARYRSFALQDASLSLQSGEGRMELSIAEARAYDGLFKGRIVAAADGAETDIRVDAALSRLDLRALFRDVPGRFRAGGVMTSRLAADARGSTPAALVRDLNGRAEVSLRKGEVGGRLLAALVGALPAMRAIPVPFGIARNAAFDAALLELSVQNGLAGLGGSWVAWPGSRAEVAGTIAVPAQNLDVHARVVPDGDGDGVAAEAATDYEIRGAWRDLRWRPGRGRS